MSLNMNRLGGFYWVRRTGGQLTLIQCFRLFIAILTSGLKSIPGFLELAGLLPHVPKAASPPTLLPSQSTLATCAERAAAAILHPEMLEHCYRSWLFGLALAQADGHQLNNDHFYCAAMLHDYGLANAKPDRDFTLDGSDCAISCALAAGLSTSSAETIADAICVHPTPGISIRRDGILGYYVQAGSLADVSGIRLWDIPDSTVQAILMRHPRGHLFKQVLSTKMRAEATAVPRGRFALLVRTGATVLIKSSIRGMR